MLPRERVLGAYDRTGYDRIPVKHEGTPEINRMIMDHYGLRNMEQLLRVVGDDFRYVELPTPVRSSGPFLTGVPKGTGENVTSMPNLRAGNTWRRITCRLLRPGPWRSLTGHIFRRLTGSTIRR